MVKVTVRCKGFYQYYDASNTHEAWSMIERDARHCIQSVTSVVHDVSRTRTYQDGNVKYHVNRSSNGIKITKNFDEIFNSKLQNGNTHPTIY